MPNYAYKAELPVQSCRACVEPFTRLEEFNAPRLAVCDRCGSRVRVVIQNKAQVTIKAQHRAGFSDYREDLARYPGDKQAYVNSPEQANRLIEERKRAGWRVRDEDWGDMHNMIPKKSLAEATPEITKEESEAMFQRSLAKGLKEQD